MSQTLLRPRPSPPAGAAAPGVRPASSARPATAGPAGATGATGTPGTPDGTLDHRLARLRDRLDAATAGVDLAPRLLAALRAGDAHPAGGARPPGPPGRTGAARRGIWRAFARSLRTLRVFLLAATVLALTAGAAGAAPLLRERVLTWMEGTALLAPRPALDREAGDLRQAGGDRAAVAGSPGPL